MKLTAALPPLSPLSPPHLPVITDPRMRVATRLLDSAARFWFVMALLGQWMFVYYIVSFYGPTTLQGDFAAWDANKFLAHGYIAGDVVGNWFFAAHVLMAAIITFGGTLQLLPQVRAHVPAVHRWNGRLYLLTVLALSMDGLYLTWIRTSPKNIAGLGTTCNSILILICAYMALRYARTRNLDQHRRWAMRTFVAVSGVWFLRVGMMLWLMLNRGMVGMTPAQDGPFDIFWAYGNFLLPLAVLELYFLARDRGGPVRRMAMAVCLFVLTLAMTGGILGTYLFFWRPLL